MTHKELIQSIKDKATLSEKGLWWCLEILEQRISLSIKPLFQREESQIERTFLHPNFSHRIPTEVSIQSSDGTFTEWKDNLYFPSLKVVFFGNREKVFTPISCRKDVRKQQRGFSRSFQEFDLCWKDSDNVEFPGTQELIDHIRNLDISQES